jgi:hypothetical protein
MDDNILQLKNMYRKKSKHSNYQILPKRLRRKIGTIDVNVKNNYEYERLEYILNKVDVKSKRILDIGGMGLVLYIIMKEIKHMPNL